MYSSKNGILEKKELADLYRSATGSGTGRGAVAWASESLGVDRKTIQRWLAGDTFPAQGQLTRLRLIAAVDARSREIRDDRLARRGIWRRFAEIFGPNYFNDVSEGAVKRAQERAEQQTRANRPFRPPARRSWLRTRSRLTI